ncbi:MAG: hypothetical protein AAF699_15015 [Pseudomonadota bacterium]
MKSELFEEFLDEFFFGEREEVMHYFAPDFSWRILGSKTVTPGASGVYKGLEGLQELISKVQGYARDYTTNELAAYAVSDKTAVTITRSSYYDVKLAAHRDAEEVWVWIFRDGLISEVWDYNRLVHVQMIENGERQETGY